MTRKQSNNQWSGGITAHPAPGNSKNKNLLENLLQLFFLDQDGVLLINYLSNGQNINVEF